MHLYKSGSTADHHKALQCFDVRKAFLGGFAFDSRLSVCGAGPWRCPSWSYHAVLHTRSGLTLCTRSASQHWHRRDHSTTVKQAWENLSLAIIVYLSPVFAGAPRYVPVTRPVPPAAGLFIMRIERAEGDKDPVRSFSPIHPLSPIPPYSRWPGDTLPVRCRATIATETPYYLQHSSFDLLLFFLPFRLLANRNFSICLLNNNGGIFQLVIDIFATSRDSGPWEFLKLGPTTFNIFLFSSFRVLQLSIYLLNNNKCRDFFRHHRYFRNVAWFRPLEVC